MTKTTRTGKTLIHTINTCPTAELLTLGFTEEQAARIIGLRSVFPLVEDSTVPCVDARKLWERSGEPHGRFKKWVENRIKPLMDDATTNAEISTALVRTMTGHLRKDYALSRGIAAKLVKQVCTEEGREIRRYFLHMERLSVLLSGDTRKHPDPTVGSVIALQGFVCRLLTGKTAGHWRETVGKGRRGIRDVLNTDDLTLYARCYAAASSLIQVGFVKEAELEKILRPAFGDKIDMSRYTEAA